MSQEPHIWLEMQCVSSTPLKISSFSSSSCKVVDINSITKANAGNPPCLHKTVVGSGLQTRGEETGQHFPALPHDTIVHQLLHKDINEP